MLGREQVLWKKLFRVRGWGGARWVQVKGWPGRVLSLMQEFLGKEFQACSGDSMAKVAKDGRLFIGCGKEFGFYFEQGGAC